VDAVPEFSLLANTLSAFHGVPDGDWSEFRSAHGVADGDCNATQLCRTLRGFLIFTDKFCHAGKNSRGPVTGAATR
jgi:hypothetical protein